MKTEQDHDLGNESEHRTDPADNPVVDQRDQPFGGPVSFHPRSQIARDDLPEKHVCDPGRRGSFPPWKPQHSRHPT